ncbi:MAG: Do family serine endopeptidase [Nitrospirales bacterium]
MMNNSQPTAGQYRRRRVALILSGIGLLLAGMFLGLSLAGTPFLSQHIPQPTDFKNSDAPKFTATPVLTRNTLTDQGDLILQNSTLIQAAKHAQPAVVNISTTVFTKDGPSWQSPFFDDPFFRRFFGDEFEKRFHPKDSPRQQGTGSGVIVSQDGYIITNNHVVENGEDIQVTLSDKRNFTAKVIGTDPKTDLALLKIEAEGLPALSWGDSRDLQVGEMVMAIGNPFGLTQTVTMGIVSAVGRANVGIVDYEDFIQTDAAINPGNSGGALINLKGELVGINTAIFSRSGGYMGIGFAIPSNMAKAIQSSLIEHGKVVRGWLGVSIQDLTPDLQTQFQAPDTRGALISEVVKESPAEEGGLKRGDIIREYNSHEVTDTRHLRSLVAESLPNAPVKIRILRDGDGHELQVTIAEMPKDISAFSSTGEAGEKHALTGIIVESAPLGEKGVHVTKVTPQSPAHRAGIREGDILLEINRKPVTSVEDFQRLTRALKADEKILILLRRNQSTIFLSITP